MTRARIIADQAARAKIMTELQTAFGVVVDAAVKGDFSRLVDVQFADAELNGLALGITSLVERVDAGIEATAMVLAAFADTDLTRRVKGDFQGVPRPAARRHQPRR